MDWYSQRPYDRQAVSTLLNQIELTFDDTKWKRNYDRSNVTDEKSCLSMSFGDVLRFEHGSHGRHGIFPSALNTRHPVLFSQLAQLSKLLEFPCTTFTVNKNLMCKPHRDRLNQGPSLILSLGKFSGGKLSLALSSGGVPGTRADYDIYHQPLLFNGATTTHWTQPFQGTRYSIILYNLKVKSAKTPSQ